MMINTYIYMHAAKINDAEMKQCKASGPKVFDKWKSSKIALHEWTHGSKMLGFAHKTKWRINI
jgi:hypothetical protein